MRIAVCVRAIQVGGASQRAVHISQLLTDAGHDVTLVIEKPAAASEVAAQGYACVSLPQRSWESAAGVVHHTVRYFHNQAFDIVFLITGPVFTGVQRSLGMLPDPTVLVPVLCGDHESVYRRIIPTAAWWNVAVTISPRIQQILAARLPEKPVRCLTTGIPLPTAADLASRGAWSLPLRLLYVGRLQGKKDVRMLPLILNACRSLSLPVTLTVIGDGPDRSQMEEAYRDMGMADLVTFRGMQPHAAVYRAMQTHHVLLFTSAYGEGLSRVLLEAQANGCVPVASRFPGITDFAIAEHETGLLAAVGDPHAFAEQIAVLVTGEERWRRYSQAGSERARALFSFDAMGRQYGQLVTEIGQGSFPLPTPRSQTVDRLPHFSRRDHAPLALLPVLDWILRFTSRRWPPGVDRHAGS